MAFWEEEAYGQVEHDQSSADSLEQAARSSDLPSQEVKS